MIKHHDQGRSYLGSMVQKVRLHGGGEVSGGQQVAGAAARSSHLGPPNLENREYTWNDKVVLKPLCPQWQTPSSKTSPYNHQSGTKCANAPVYWEHLFQASTSVWPYFNCYELFSFFFVNSDIWINQRQCATNQYLRKENDPHRYCTGECAVHTKCGPVIVPEEHLQVRLPVPQTVKRRSKSFSARVFR